MRHGKRWIPAALLVIVGLGLVVWLVTRERGSTALAESAGSEPPARIEAIEGSDFKLVTLTEKAAERLDVQTVALRDEQIDGATRKVVPYGAILYGTKGETWIYTNPEPLVYVRQAITLDRIEGDQAILSDGPPADTPIVVVAVAELYGAETGFGGSGGH